MHFLTMELIEGRPVDARTDIFALGIVLYELATGERPFAGESSAMLMTTILRDEPLDGALAAVESNAGYAHAISVGLTYTAMGRRTDAISVLEDALSASAVPFIALGVRAGNLMLDGQDMRARDTLARLDTPEYAVSRAVGYACYHVVCEQFDQARDHLLQAAADRSPWAPLMTTLNPRFRHSPAGRAVLDALGISSQ